MSACANTTNRFSGIGFLLMLAFANCAPVRAEVSLPTDIAVTMRATPDSGLRTGQVIDFALTVTNNGFEPADTLVLVSSFFFHEVFFTKVDAVSCYQFGGSVAEGQDNPWFNLEWFVSGFAEDMHPFAPGESRTCHFQMTLGADAGAVYPFTFSVSTYDPDLNPANSSATVYLRREVPMVPAFGALFTAMLIALVAGVGAVAVGKKSRGRDACALEVAA